MQTEERRMINNCEKSNQSNNIDVDDSEIKNCIDSPPKQQPSNGNQNEEPGRLYPNQTQIDNEYHKYVGKENEHKISS